MNQEGQLIEQSQTDQLPEQSQASPDSTQQKIQEIQQALDLDKAERIRFKGQEYKREDFEKALMFEKDYRKKTASLSKEKETYSKSVEEDKHYMSHLPYDLMKVMQNPQLAAQFIKTYPDKFHSYLKTVLSENQVQQETQTAKPDVELLSKVERLEKVLHDQEVAKSEAAIQSQVDKLAKVYTDALPEVVIGRVYESYLKSNEKPSDETWEAAFKQHDLEMKNLVKTKYGNLVQKQTKANSKAKDVDAGGGTLDRAPKKFKSLKEVTEFAAKDLTGRQ